MKYVEQFKSLLLTVLVCLSIVFTLVIWNYKPDYAVIEETQVEEVLIGEKKQLQDIIKPYRILYRVDDTFTGSASNSVLNELYSHFATWHLRDFNLVNSNISNEKMNELLRVNERATLFFNAEIPLQTFSNVLSVHNKDLSEVGFNRLIIDWSNVRDKDELEILFLNTEKHMLFGSTVELNDSRRFLAQFVRPAKDYLEYYEIERNLQRSLYVVKEPLEITQYTYLNEELSIEKFKNIVFLGTNIVQSKEESTKSEKYTDGTSLMTVDTQNRILNYVYPTAESVIPISSPKLILESFNFVNEHGGFSSDYRLSSMNVGKHNLEYQLFVKGYPVHSNITSTRITTTWGENFLYRYRRPYYSIESEVPNERALRTLPAGEKVVNYLRGLEDLPFNEIDEIIVGYNLIQNPDYYILDPTWFAISNNDWIRITPEQLGGVVNGLE